MPTLKRSLAASAPRLGTGCSLTFAGLGLSSNYIKHAKLAHSSITITFIYWGVVTLRDWQSYADYQQYLLSVLTGFLDNDRDRLVALESSISELYLLNLDLLENGTIAA